MCGLVIIWTLDLFKHKNAAPDVLQLKLTKYKWSFKTAVGRKTENSDCRTFWSMEFYKLQNTELLNRSRVYSGSLHYNLRNLLLVVGGLVYRQHSDY